WPAEFPVAIGMRLGDLDGNRRPDVVVQLRHARAEFMTSLSSALGRENLTFTEGIVHWERSGPLPWPVDLDDDGRAEWLQGAQGVFRSEDERLPVRILSEGPVGWDAFPVDLENDGRVDRLSWDAVRYERVDQPSRQVPTVPGYDPETTVVGDFNRDGWVDLLAGGWMYFGRGGTSNHPPAAPDGLRVVTVAPGAVRLAWDVAADPNQTDPLTYNLRIGASPGGGDIMPPMSLPDGTRMLVARGNVGGARRWVVSGLTPGRTYHAAVQAVDNAYAGGPFSTEVAFTVATEIRPPVLVSAAFATNGWSLRAEGAPGENLLVQSSAGLETWTAEWLLNLDDFGEGHWVRGPGIGSQPVFVRTVRP
ncbi:MAG: fibronectin type III domain-containing protein, partial [Verrucomicrobia bacterium]|nr:fibronectin type III domain-containing protein [Verrucomicrobiota bacterium]